MHIQALVVSLLISCTVYGRDWHGADGRTLSGDFVKVVGDSVGIRVGNSPVVVKLSSLSAEDQTYAQTAQSYVDQATKLGPQTFEVSGLIANGVRCRKAQTMSDGKPLFIGEEFILLSDSAPMKRGDRAKDVPIYFIGQRSFHPTNGQPHPINVFALTVDAALAAVGGPTDVYEPIIKSEEVRGIGISIADGAVVLVGSPLVAGATSIELFLGDDHPTATVLGTSQELGVTILTTTGKGSVPGARLQPRKPIEANQPIAFLSYAFDKRRRALEAPVIVEGKVTKLGETKGHFEIDVKPAADSVGGLVLSSKGDVVGLVPGSSAKSSDMNCIRTDELTAVLKNIPKGTATKSMTTSSAQETAKSVQPSIVVVRVLKETIQEPTKAKPTTQKPKGKAKPKAKAKAKATTPPPAPAKTNEDASK